MNNTSPFSFLQSLATRFQPPAWAVDEGQQKLVLLLNHVLMQEKVTLFVPSVRFLQSLLAHAVVHGSSTCHAKCFEA